MSFYFKSEKERLVGFSERLQQLVNSANEVPFPKIRPLKVSSSKNPNQSNCFNIYFPFISFILHFQNRRFKS